MGALFSTAGDPATSAAAAPGNTYTKGNVNAALAKKANRNNVNKLKEKINLLNMPPLADEENDDNAGAPAAPALSLASSRAANTNAARAAANANAARAAANANAARARAAANANAARARAAANAAAAAPAANAAAAAPAAPTPAPPAPAAPPAAPPAPVASTLQQRINTAKALLQNSRIKFKTANGVSNTARRAATAVNTTNNNTIATAISTLEEALKNSSGANPEEKAELRKMLNALKEPATSGGRRNRNRRAHTRSRRNRRSTKKNRN